MTIIEVYVTETNIFCFMFGFKTKFDRAKKTSAANPFILQFHWFSLIWQINVFKPGCCYDDHVCMTVYALALCYCCWWPNCLEHHWTLLRGFLVMSCFYGRRLYAPGLINSAVNTRQNCIFMFQDNFLLFFYIHNCNLHLTYTQYGIWRHHADMLLSQCNNHMNETGSGGKVVSSA